MQHRTVAPVRTYSIDALLAEGFTVSGIRTYVKRGVLPPAHGRGPHAYYDERHLRILREIKKARDERRTMSDIRDWAHECFPHAFPEDR